MRAVGDIEGMIGAWKGVADDLLAASGLLVLHSSSSYGRLCKAINDAQIDVWTAILARSEGDEVPTPPMPQPLVVPARVVSPAAERTFESIVLALIDKRHTGFNEPTKERVRGALRFLKEAVGDLKPSELTRERVTVYLGLLAERPSRLPKADFHRDLKELAALYKDRDDVKRLTSKTIEAYCLALNARWKEAQSEGSIPEVLASPFSGRKFSRKALGPKAAKGFSPEELTAYFSMPAFKDGERPTRGKGEAIYWIPLLMLFTGARPEEVAQLLVADIFQHEQDGRWVIRFTDEGWHPVKGQQSLKTDGQESGRRTFPVPQPLIDLGLLAYRKSLQEAGEAALFPLLRRKGKRGGIYASFGEWMCEYVYGHGVLKAGEGRQPVREFRHTWTTAARASRIPRDAMEYMQGHRPPDGGSSHEVYGEREALGEWIDQLDFKVDTRSLARPWKV
jgi:integrase